MPLFFFLHRHGLWISWPLMGLGAFLLWNTIAAAVKLGDRNLICRLPLQPENQVEFRRAGKVILWLESPLLSNRFSGLKFELVGSDGSRLEGSRILVRSKASSFSQVRISDRTFQVPHAGIYTLVTSGLGEVREGDDRHEFVFRSPNGVRTIVTVLGIVLGALLLIGGLVNFLLRLTARGGS